MSDPHDPYPVEPSSDTPRPPASPPPPPEPAKPQPRIDAPRLLDEFDDDVDLTADPEVDLAVGRPPTRTVAAAPVEDARPEFVQPGLGEPRHWAIAGGVLLLGAMIASGVNAPYGVGATQVALRVLLTLYNTLVSAGTGVVALFIAARLLEQRFGSIELAAGRMFAAVGAFMLITNLEVRITGVRGIDQTVLLILAAAAYLLIVAWSFKIWNRVTLTYIAGSHMLLWLVMLVGMSLSAAIKPGTAPPTGNSSPVREPPPAVTGATGSPPATSPVQGP